MLERGVIRVLVVPNRVYFFTDRFEQKGITCEIVKAFEADLNKRFGLKGSKRVGVLFVPVNRAQLVPYLTKGVGDIAAANLTVTPERQAKVDFSSPFSDEAREVIVRGTGAAPIAEIGVSVSVVLSPSGQAQLSNPFGSRAPGWIPLEPGDQAMMKKAMRDALDRYEVGSASEWISEKTGHGGRAVVTDTFEVEGLAMRATDASVYKRTRPDLFRSVVLGRRRNLEVGILVNPTSRVRRSPVAGFAQRLHGFLEAFQVEDHCDRLLR